jgi:hypothetical protein
LALDAAGEELGHLLNAPNNPLGFERAWDWLESLRCHHRLRITLQAMETSGVYYWAWWDFLARPLKTLRLEVNTSGRRWLPRSPAMAAGLTDHIWTVKELAHDRLAMI